MTVYGLSHTLALVTLREWLREAGVLKTELAMASTMRWGTVHQIVTGRSTPSVRTARRLADGAARIVDERGLAVRPITAAEILGVSEESAA